MADVRVDVFERDSRIAEHLRTLGIRVDERSLAVGDYVIGDAVVERKTARHLGSAIVRGQLGIDVVRSVDPIDSAMWLAVLTRHPNRTAGKRRPWYAQQPAHADVSEAMLAAVPGIAFRGASALLARFGSVRAVVNATEDEWMEVPGIGPKRAAALAHAITHRIQPS